MTPARPLRLWTGIAVLALAAAALIAVDSGTAVATAPDTALAYLNQQRAAFGESPVSLDQSLLRPECTLENHHIASPRTEWSATTTPWIEAPYHESFLFDPAGSRASYGEYDGFRSNDPAFPSREGTWACMWFDFGEKYRTATTVSASPSFWWAGEGGGPETIPTVVRANEFPSTPAEDLGLPSNTTGPNLLLYALGMGSTPQVTSASVVGESGNLVDSRVATIGAIPWGRVLVMPQAAQPLTTYRATVVWCRSEDSYCQPQTFAFRTGLEQAKDEVETRDPRLKFASVRARGRHLRVDLRLDPEALEGGALRLQAVRLGLRHPKPRTLTLDPHLRAYTFLGRGHWRLRAGYVPSSNRVWLGSSVSRSVWIGRRPKH